MTGKNGAVFTLEKGDGKPFRCKNPACRHERFLFNGAYSFREEIVQQRDGQTVQVLKLLWTCERCLLINRARGNELRAIKRME